jgi:hypothetical protein
MKQLLKLIGYSNQFRKPQTVWNFDILNWDLPFEIYSYAEVSHKAIC